MDSLLEDRGNESFHDAAGAADAQMREASMSFGELAPRMLETALNPLTGLPELTSKVLNPAWSNTFSAGTSNAPWPIRATEKPANR